MIPLFQREIFPVQVQAPLQKTLFFKANVGQLLCQDSVFERLWTNHDTFAAVYEAFQDPRKRDPRRGRYTPGGWLQWLQTLTDVFWWVSFRLLDQFSKATSKSFASAKIWLCSHQNRAVTALATFCHVAVSGRLSLHSWPVERDLVVGRSRLSRPTAKWQQMDGNCIWDRSTIIEYTVC